MRILQQSNLKKILLLERKINLVLNENISTIYIRNVLLDIELVGVS